MNSGRKAIGAERLGKRDRLILADVIRYRVITNDWVLGRYLPGAKPNAAVKITGRLEREGWLAGHSLYQRKRYFTPGSRLARQQGLPGNRTRPLGAQSLALHYVLLRYCLGLLDGKSPQCSPHLATPEEMKATYPWLPASMLCRPSVLASDPDTSPWRLVRVDLGGRPDHVARKCAIDLAHLDDLEPFRVLLHDRRFVMVVLTATKEKRRLIEQALADRPWPVGSRFQIGVIPDLFHFVPSR